jgi:hypothetical protein
VTTGNELLVESDSTMGLLLTTSSSSMVVTVNLGSLEPIVLSGYYETETESPSSTPEDKPAVKIMFQVTQWQ